MKARSQDLTDMKAKDEIIVFDSTGVAIEDAVATAAVYERARANHIGTDFHFAV